MGNGTSPKQENQGEEVASSSCPLTSVCEPWYVSHTLLTINKCEKSWSLFSASLQTVLLVNKKKRELNPFPLAFLFFAYHENEEMACKSSP